ncbi:MAPK/MAK/MRK overlapping kinase [Camelus dromedarius]|uniref:MAPK/MAK/MRK overlapping kinase n=1 Tax=Camelus dromedarius TaxID=9838 RepID=A0A5N4E379_CAMDR|nr:MAPK/MAK/MRK overlapping kinase [Camelus dromedarius]
MDMWSAGCVLYEVASPRLHLPSLQPLFPGANELDQISRIHDIIGTPTEKTLAKFKQSRAMSFDFPFKKGSGIPLLTASLSPQCLSLLHAMVAYDPDERITAHQALQHPYFHQQRWARWRGPAGPAVGQVGSRSCASTSGNPQPAPSGIVSRKEAAPPPLYPPCRATEKQALASHWRKATTFFPKHPVAPELLSSTWQTPKEGQKQKQTLKQEKDHPRRPGPAYLMELPKLKLAGVTKLSSYSSLALQSVLAPGANGRVPLLRPLKCVGANQKTDAQKDIKPTLKQRRLPTVDRRGGGC